VQAYYSSETCTAKTFSHYKKNHIYYTYVPHYRFCAENFLFIMYVLKPVIDKDGDIDSPNPTLVMYTAGYNTCPILRLDLMQEDYTSNSAT